MVTPEQLECNSDHVTTYTTTIFQPQWEPFLRLALAIDYIAGFFMADSLDESLKMPRYFSDLPDVQTLLT